MRVLLVEQDAALGKILADRLREERFDVNWMSELPDDFDVAYEAIVLDRCAAPSDLTAMMAALRARDELLPIIIMGSEEDAVERVQVLNAGADDFLTRPINADELVARLKAILRRVRQVPAQAVSVGVIQLDPIRRAVTREGCSVPVTASEYRILAMLMMEPGRLVSRARLEAQLYGLGEEVASNTVEVHIHNLRRKLGERFIRNVRGRGYRVAPSRV